MPVAAPAPADAGVASAREQVRIALVGNPNTGKTTLFNRLCGARAKTSNFPGTTTASRVGRAALPGDWLAEVIDLPGIYELGLDVPETRIARDVLTGTGLYRQPDAVLVVVRIRLDGAKLLDLHPSRAGAPEDVDAAAPDARRRIRRPGHRNDVVARNIDNPPESVIAINI